MATSRLATLPAPDVKVQTPAAPATTVIVRVISGDNRIDPLLEGADFRFNSGSPVGTPVTVTFAFPDTMPNTYSGEDALEWKPFSAEQRSATREILALLQQQIGITFQEVADTPNATGTMRFGNNKQTTSAGYALLPNANGNDKDADTWIAIGYDTNTVKGTYAYGTLVHEIGHAIGLNHPGNYNAGEAKTADVVGNYLGVAEDTFFNSIMSYRQSTQDLSGIWFQPYDMLALRYLYGKVDFNATSTTYTYSDSDGKWVNNIVDDGGVDTLDFSALSGGVAVQLNPGAFSDVGKTNSGDQARGNLTISFDATIENVIGTAQNDTIFGNAANNRIRGNAGNDTIDGGSGGDTAVYSGSKATYNVVRTAGGMRVSGGSDGTDSLVSIERLQFTDAQINFDTAATESTGKSILLLGAALGNSLLLAKKPLIGAVADLFDNPSFSMPVLAGALMRLPIWGTLAAGGAATATNEEIATYLLRTVNGTAPDATAVSAGAARLASETGGAQGGFLAELAISANNLTQVNLVGYATTGIDLGPPTA